MNLFRTREDLRRNPPKKVSIAIGVFDGVHLGHQQVIRQTISDAKLHNAQPYVVTFDRHPATIVAPESAPQLIYSLPQKLRAIESLGVAGAWLIRFDNAFSQIPGDEFVRQLVDDFGSITSICVGRNFSFGHRRSGNVGLLQSLGARYHFAVHALAAVALDHETVSSTRVRQAIRAGQLELASEMLGRTYAVAGAVVKGDQLGSKIGFPTANVDTTNLVLPPNGVYAGLAQHDAQIHPAVLNIGLRPTVSNASSTPRLEVHLLDGHKDLYGQELEVSFVERLRSERQFPSLAELKNQIGRDIDRARSLLERP